MPPTLQDFGLDRPSIEDRIALAQLLWNSAAREAEEAPLTPAQRQELERRLADSIARPDAVTPWEIVKGRVLARTARASSRSLEVRGSSVILPR
jgi:putative addiction module component (TIGR02574 family)